MSRLYTWDELVRDAVKVYPWENEPYTPRPRLDPSSHGRRLYRKGCRCDDCRAGNAETQRNRRHRAQARAA